MAIRHTQRVKEVLERTRADAVMIGRAAQGRPDVSRDHHYLDTGENLLRPKSKKYIVCSRLI